jgi:hypothetical protein
MRVFPNAANRDLALARCATSVQIVSREMVAFEWLERAARRRSEK